VSAAIRPSLGAPHARLLGLGAYRPATVVTNAEICARIDSTDEWIRERSGIVERRRAAEDESVVDMAVVAAEKALAAAGISPEQVGCVPVATFTWLWQTPAAAALVADRLGATSAAAFDVSAACAGFTYGLALANDMVRGGSSEYVLVIGSEKLSDVVDPTDRGSAFLFGDGAGAVVVGPSTEPGIGPVVWGADGAQGSAITQTESWNVLREDPGATFPHLTMKGQAVFRWAVYEMAPVASQALERAGVRPQDLDAFIPHQANLRIVDAMVRRIGLPETVAVARDIADTGNTSAASIPLAMSRLLDSGAARSGDTALVIGYGAGLAYAAQVVALP
jgi:3-oxoacyl-[acyl-carrier-protein] synthase III